MAQNRATGARYASRSAPAWREPGPTAAEERDSAAEMALAAALAPSVPAEVIEVCLDELSGDRFYRNMDRRHRVETLVRRSENMAGALTSIAATTASLHPDPVPRSLRLLGSGNGHWCPGRLGLEKPAWARGSPARCKDCLRTARNLLWSGAGR